MHPLRDKYAIAGAGKSRLGRVPGVNALGLLEEAMHNARDEAGSSALGIDGMVCRGPDDVDSHHRLMAQRLGVNAAFSTTLDNGGASQILACLAINAGLATDGIANAPQDMRYEMPIRVVFDDVAEGVTLA